MEKGFVYVARLIDYNGNFVGNFYKVGKSLQYKVRETQLNSTHLPMDVLLVRVFETDYMNHLEKILHIALVDYRIEKKYKDRRNITTEWFDLEDDEDFNHRIDETVRNFPFVQEVNLISKIQSDSGTTQSEKQEYIGAIRKNKSKLILLEDGVDITQSTAQDTFCLAMAKIAKIVGVQEFMKQTVLLADSMEKLKENFPKSLIESYVRVIDDCYIWVCASNANKAKYLNEFLKNNGITKFQVLIEN